MSLCQQCQKIDLSTLQKDFLLHDDWPALEACAKQTGCELCELIYERLSASLCSALPKLVLDRNILNSWDLDKKGCLTSLPHEWYQGCHTNIVVAPFKPHAKFNKLTLQRMVYESRSLEVYCKEYGAWFTFRTAYVTPANMVGSNLHYAERSEGLFYKFVQATSIPMFCLKDDPLSKHLLLPVRRIVDNDEPHIWKIKQVEKWIDECRTSHVECDNVGDATVIPKRLIRLDRKENQIWASIVEISAKPHEGYVTLSYCWGRYQQQWIETVRKLHERCTSFIIDVMPATLRDAAIVCCELGYRYLWIDALCILQGNQDDWRVESEKMSDIFANSTLTISATDIANCQDGFLDRQRQSWNNFIRLELQTEDGPGVLWLSKSFYSPGVIGAEGFVDERAWCLQERHFASRILHYCQEEIYLECSRSRRYESEVYRDPDSDQGLSGLEVDKLSMKQLDEFRRGRKPSVHLWTNRSWYEMLKEYSIRSLTESDDKLVAISGLTKRAVEHVKSTYLAGIWLSHLAFGLSWSLNTPKDRLCSPPRRATSYWAPSWSWASVDGALTPAVDIDAINNAFSTLDTSDFYTPQIEVLDAKTKTRQGQPFGQVLDAELKLRGKLKLINMAELRNVGGEYHGPWPWEPNPANPYQKGSYIEDEHKTHSGDYWCLYLARHFEYAPAPSTLYLLVLEPVECAIANTYRRLGFAMVWDLAYFEDVQAQEFRFI